MKIRSPMLTWLAGACVAWPMGLIARTLRYQFHQSAPLANPADPDCPDRYLVALWHDAILPPVMYRQRIRKFTENNAAAALVSQHQDGSYLVEAMRWFRVTAVRGSASKGGARALKQLIELAGRTHIFVTPDGPRGPRRQLKDGILYLASQSGLPIIAVASACSRSWRMKGSWTDLEIPLPFARAHVVLGPPFHVPPDASRETLEACRRELQGIMDELNARAERLAAGRPEPASADEVTRRAA